MKKPLETKKQTIIKKYEELFIESPFFIAEVKINTGFASALNSAQYNLGIRDSLILTSLVENNISGFITADKYLSKIDVVDILLLSRYSE